jgi:hypothetical protein
MSEVLNATNEVAAEVVAVAAKKTRKPNGITVPFVLIAVVAMGLYKRLKRALSATEILAEVVKHPKFPKGAELTATAIKVRLQGVVPTDFLEAIGRSKSDTGFRFVTKKVTGQNGKDKDCQFIDPTCLPLTGRSVDVEELADLLGELDAITAETPEVAGTES